MSVSAAAFALDTRSGKIRLPLFKRMDVGRSKRISFAKVLSRADGDRDVVTRGRGSTKPDVRAYSSSTSMMSPSFPCPDGRDSSYLKSSRRRVSFAMEGSKGFPDAREALSWARFSAIDASRRRSAKCSIISYRPFFIMHHVNEPFRYR